MKLTFEEENHIYRLDGEIIPSVTQVISPLNNFDSIPVDVLNAKARWGKSLHRMIELFSYGSLVEKTLSDAQKRVLEQYLLFLGAEGRDYDFNEEIVEYMMFDPRLKYAGKCDKIIPGQMICDLKSRPFDPIKDPIQLMAYHKLWLKCGGEPGKYEHRVLSLFENNYKFQKCSMKDAWSKFRELLENHKRSEEFNRKIRIWKGQK